jgi:hypothetical protein
MWSLEEKDHLGDLGVDGSLMLKYILQKCGFRIGMSGWLFLTW